MRLDEGCLVTKFLITAIAVVLSGCASSTRVEAIHPHITLEGHLFNFDALSTVIEGMSSAQVRETLGEPLEISEAGDNVTWRYYERAKPRWCDGGTTANAPEYQITALLVFTNGALASKTVEQVGTPAFP